MFDNLFLKNKFKLYTFRLVFDGWNDNGKCLHFYHLYDFHLPKLLCKLIAVYYTAWYQNKFSYEHLRCHYELDRVYCYPFVIQFKLDGSIWLYKSFGGNKRFARSNLVKRLRLKYDYREGKDYFFQTDCL